MIRIISLLTFVFCPLLTRICAEPFSLHEGEHRRLTVDGYQRDYWIYTPGSLPRHPHLVIMLHGWGQSGEAVLHTFGWQKQADAYHFLVAFPDALPVRADLPPDAALPRGTYPRSGPQGPNSRSWWTAEQLRSIGNTNHPDDEHFLAELVAHLRAQEGVASGIFMAGFSNGAAMAKYFALRHPAEVRAVAAAGFDGDRFPARLTHPISILQLSGAEDSTGNVTVEDWRQMSVGQRLFWYGSTSLRPTVQSDMKGWAALDSCSAPLTQTTLWGRSVKWRKCAGHSEVQLILVSQLGHEWVGASTSRWKQSHPAGSVLDFSALAGHFFADKR